MRERQPEARYYFLEYNGEHQSFTQIVESDVNKLYNNDFAKLRVFRHKDGARLVCYAPNILGDIQVTTPELFANAEYRNLWGFLLQNMIQDTVSGKFDFEITEEDRIRHRISKRLRRSMVVMANYLFSLSMMIRCQGDFEDAIARTDSSATLKESDIALLTGPKLAPQITQILNGFYIRGIISTSIRREIRLPDIIVTDDRESEYEYLSSVALFNALTAEEAIKGVFNMAYKVASNLKKNYTPQKGAYVLESFQSLYQKPNMSLRGFEGELLINKTVDCLIDKGYIVPVYERVKDLNGTDYWRRFFRATHTAALLS